MSLQDIFSRIRTATDLPSPIVSSDRQIHLTTESFLAIGGTNTSHYRTHGMNTFRLLGQLSELESLKSNQEITNAVVQAVKETFGIQGDGFINLNVIKQPYGTLTPIEPNGLESLNSNDQMLSLVSQEELQLEINKRRALNHLIQGGAYHSRQMIDSVLQNLHIYSREHSELAHEFYKDANLSFFLVPDNSVNLGSMTPAATCQVSLQAAPASVTANAPVIPLLLHESVNGILDIVSSHGLPNSDQNSTAAERKLASEVRKFVLHHADQTQFELWDRRFGISLWRKNFGTILTPQTLFDFQEFAMRPAAELLRNLQQ